MGTLTYTVSAAGKSYDRWHGPIDPEMRQLVEVVAEVVDAGVFYSTDVHSAVTARYALSAEELQRGRGRVEGGEWGMEIYYARRQLDRERADAREREAFTRLALKPGQNVGAIEVVANYRTRRFRNAIVESAELNAIRLRATAGGRRFTLTLSAAGLAQGLERMQARAV